MPGTILNIKAIAENKETDVPALRKLTFWLFKTVKAFNDYSNLPVSLEDQGKGAGDLRKEKEM